MAEIAGLKLIVPSSVAGSGVSVSASGKVSFTAATSVSVNGCFSATYDNYLIVTRCSYTAASAQWAVRLRSSGTDASATNYVMQGLEANSTSVSGSRFTSQSRWFGGSPSSNYSGDHLYLYGPSLAQPTAYRVVMIGGYLGAYIYDNAGTHSLSTAYDGFTYYVPSGSATGSLTIYGLSQ